MIKSIVNIKSITDLSREEVEILGRIGFNKSSTLHYDICKALAEGKKQEQIAEDFHTGDRIIRYIKSEKCPNCGPLAGPPKKV